MLRVRARWSPYALIGTLVLFTTAPAARADVEPNDVGVRAEGLPATTTTITGTVGTDDRDDWYRLNVKSGEGDALGHLQLERTSPSTPACRSPQMYLIDRTYAGGIGTDIQQEPIVGTTPQPGVSEWYFHVIYSGCETAYSAQITTSGGASRLDDATLSAQPVPEAGDTAASAYRPLAERAFYSGEIGGPTDEDWLTFSVGPGSHTVGVEGARAANGVPDAAVRLTSDPASPGIEFRANEFGVRETMDVVGPAQLWVRVANDKPFAAPIPWWVAVDAGGAVVPAPGAVAVAPSPVPPSIPTTGSVPARRATCSIATAKVRRPRPIRVVCRGAAKGARVELRLQRVRGRSLGRAVRRTAPVRRGAATRSTKGLARGTYRVAVWSGTKRLALRRVVVR